MVTSEAVRELRKTFGESQQAFSNRLGLSMSSIANYEIGHRHPDYAVTLRLYRAACEAERKDLAAYFLMLINAGIVGRTVVPVVSDDERAAIQAVQAILSEEHLIDLRKPLMKLLAAAQERLRKIADIPQTAKRRKATKIQEVR